MSTAAFAGAPRLPWRAGRDLRLLLWAVALAVYVAGIGAAGLRILARDTEAAGRAAAAVLTLEVPADTSPARLKTALAVLKETHGITAARLLTAAETAALLEPWLGPGAQLDGLPLPRLVDVRADPAARIDLATLRRHLAAVAPGARLDDNGQSLSAADAAAGRLRLLFAACVLAGLAAVAAASAFAASSAAEADRDLLDLAHRLGARDRDLARPFAWRALRLGLAGGAAGGLAAAATLIAFAASPALPDSLKAAGRAADWQSWAILAGVAVAAGLLAALAAWAGLRRRLLRLP